jgi:hypothetical protein
MLRGVLASQARGDEIDRAASGIELAARSATLTKLKPKTAAAVSSQRFVSSAVRIWLKPRQTLKYIQSNNDDLAKVLRCETGFSNKCFCGCRLA